MLDKIRNNITKVHRWLMWFWIANFPIAVALYFFTNEKTLLLYTIICSVYANVESSASAKEASKEKDT